MENGSVKKTNTKKSPEELFNKFVEAQDCPEILQTFQRLVNAVGVVAETPREFYQSFKSKLQSWKCKSLWELLDIRANQNEYSKGSVCEDIHALVIGCGPIGLRTAIELALLGAQVVIVEKRNSFSRNNVLHLWPFLLSDFRSLGAKKFYGKFCSGAINHISIRRLQAILLKTALIVGVKVFTGVAFEKVIEPINEDTGWKCHVTPSNEGLSDYEVDVIIGADGKKNILPGFAQNEMRGSLAIGITTNFVNYDTEEEKRVEEISGIAYQFNPGFFDRLKQQKGVHLENIVYYKDETHYFVMTAVKSSLLKRGVLKKDHSKPQKLLNQENVDHEKLVSYVLDTVHYATKGQLTNLDFKRDDKGKADIAAFDFTSIKKAENSARILERKGHKLLLGLVGDSLLEPFWPTGSGCARGVLSALDAAWMVRSFAQDKPPLQILSERENIYRLLSGTSTENMHKNHALYTINPTSRYTHIPQKKIQEVYHLYDTDDPVNADFSLGSPTGLLANKVGKKSRRVSSTALKPHYRPNRRQIKFATSPTSDSPFSSSGSSLEDLTPLGARKRQKIDATARRRTRSETLTSGGEEVHDITTASSKGSKKAKKGTKSVKSPAAALKITKSVDIGGRMKSKKHKQLVDRTVSSPVSAKEKTHKRRSFFVFGRARSKSRTGKKSPRNTENVKEIVEEEIRSTAQSQVESSSGDILSRDESYQREMSQFSRNHPMRRSARDIIAEIEARNNSKTSQAILREDSSYDRSLREIAGNKASIKRATSDSTIYATPPNKHTKTEDLWKEIESMSPVAKAAVPALVKMSPDYQKENDFNAVHSGVHDLSSAMRIAGLMAMATPLLASTCRQQGSVKDRPWYSRNAGRVKDTISKYDSLNERKYLANDGTPLRPPNDRVDNADCKPTLAEVAERIMKQQRTGRLEDFQRPVSWHPTAISVVEGKTDIKTISDKAMASAREQELEKIAVHGSYKTPKRSNALLYLGLAKFQRDLSCLKVRFQKQLLQNEVKLRILGKELSTLDQESTDSPTKKDFSSRIYQKTFIAQLNKDENDDSKTKPNDITGKTAGLKDKIRGNDVDDDEAAELKDSRSIKDINVGVYNSDDNSVPKDDRLQTPKKQLSVTRDYAMEAEWRKSPALAKKEMDRVMLNLTETMSRDRAMTSIKFLISMYRRIQRNPKEDKFRRIFKSRVKFKKYVWTVRNAKMFFLASGWMEVGSFLLFPAEKNVKEPLAILNKYLGLLENGSTVQISTIKSTSRREAHSRTSQTVLKETGTEETPQSTTTRNPFTTCTSSNETPRKRPTNTPKKTPSMDNRFSRSVPMDLNNWDLEMEDPLEQVSVKHSDKKSSLRRRLVSSALEHRTPRSLVTPDIAIMEEIDELSNTLDDLMETLEDVEKVNEKKIITPVKSQRQEIQDLCTTLDYMLDSSEEEELDLDLKTLESSRQKKDVVTPAVTPAKTSAFSRVPSGRKKQLPSPTSMSKTTVDGDKVIDTHMITGSDSSNFLVRNKNRLTASGSANNLKDKFQTSDKNARADTHFDLREDKSQTPNKSKLKTNPGTPENSTNNRNHAPAIPDKRDSQQIAVQDLEQSSSSESHDGKIKRRPSRRKLPEQPKTDGASTKTNSLDCAKQSSQVTTNEGPIKRQISQESLLLLQSRFGSESDVSTTKTANSIRKDRAFQLSKKKGQTSINKTISESGSTTKEITSFDQKSRKTSESVDKQKSSSLSRNGSAQRSSIKKSQSTIDVRQHNKTDVNSLKVDKQTKSAAKDGKVLTKTASNGLSRNDSKTRHTSQLQLTKNNNNALNSDNTSKTRPTLTREDSGTESISSIDSVTLKSRPPSGIERTRSARARRRQKISEKLESLETSYDSLERSPKKTGRASRNNSTSSSISIASSSSKTTIASGTSKGKTSLTKTNSIASETSEGKTSLTKTNPIASGISKGKTSLTKTNPIASETSEGKTSLTKTNHIASETSEGKTSLTKTNSIKRNSSLTSQLRQEISTTEKSRPSTMRCRSLSASAKRMPSSSSLERQKKNPSAKDEKSRGRSNSLKDKLTKPNVSQSSKHTSSFGNGRGSIKTKHRQLPSTNNAADPSKAHSNDKDKALEVAPSIDVDDKSRDNQNTTYDLNDSFDSITVSESVYLENDSYINCNNSAKHSSNSSVYSNIDDSKELFNHAMIESLQLQKDEENDSDDMKVEMKLENTGSWMVLDYESCNSTPVSTRKNSRTIIDPGSLVSISKDVEFEDLDIVKGNGTAHGVLVHEEDHYKVNGKFVDVNNFAPMSPDSSCFDSESRYSSVISDDTDSIASDIKEIPGQENHFQTNGTVVDDEPLPGGEIMRRNALRKKKDRKSEDQKRKRCVAKDRSSGVKGASLVEEQHTVKSSSFERPSIETKNKTNEQFVLRRKTIGESCSDINGTVEPLSPVITNKTNTPPLSLTTKSGDKKKISPLKLLAKRRKLPETRTVKNA